MNPQGYQSLACCIGWRNMSSRLVFQSLLGLLGLGRVSPSIHNFISSRSLMVSRMSRLKRCNSPSGSLTVCLLIPSFQYKSVLLIWTR